MDYHCSQRFVSRAEASTNKIRRVFQHIAEFCFTVTGEGRNSSLYDLVPIDRFVFGACPLAVGVATSDAPIFRGLTGGVYKAQEHIHRSVADLRLLAIPASRRRVAAFDLNWGVFSGICSCSRTCFPLYTPL